MKKYNTLPLAVVSFTLSLTAFTLSIHNSIKTEGTEPTAEVQTLETTDIVFTTDEPLAQPTIPEAPKPTYTAEELEYLALVIYQEAGADTCSDTTRMMVGNVVLNRVEDKYFPDTIAEVLTQRAQYGRLHWTGLVWADRASQEAEAHAVQRAYDCARRLLEGERVLPVEVVYQAEFEQGNETVAYSDGMYFCKR